MLDFVQANWVSIVGALIGLLYLYLEYKANVWMWAASIAMAGFYIYIFYDTKLYASMAIYAYFFAASVYGWAMWLMHGRDRDTGKDIISHVPKRYIYRILFAILFIFGIISIVLTKYGSVVIYISLGDALATSLNVVALWMAARKWAEQWLLLVPANLISASLLFIQNDMMSGGLFLIFFAVSIMGYFNWKKMIVNTNHDDIKHK